MPLSDGQSRPNFPLPTNTSGHGNALKFGRGLHVYYDLQPANVWSEHGHTCAQIVLALDPVDASLSWRSATLLRTKGCCVPYAWFVPSNTPHAMTWRGDPAAMVVIYLESEFITQECGDEPKEGAVLRLSPLIQQDYMLCRFCHHFRELCHRRAKMSESMVFAGAAVLSSTVLQACVRQTDAAGRSLKGLSDKLLEPVLNYIDAHIGESITPAELSALVGLSEDYFGRMFRRVTGKPTMKYIWRCRLQRARQLLEAGGKTTVVAAELGFCDQSHLDRKFRQEFGCSPGSVSPRRSKN